METNKFYINEEGIIDKRIWNKAFLYALSLLENNSVERIVFYFSRKDKIEIWFDKIKDKKLINSLWGNGKLYAEYNNVTFCARTTQTYKKDNFYNDIVISFGCVSSLLKELDKIETVRYIIAVPWQLSLIDEWIKESNAHVVE